MPTKLCRWGNSLGLRVSSYIVDCAHWKAGDSMEVRLLENGDVLRHKTFHFICSHSCLSAGRVIDFLETERCPYAETACRTRAVDVPTWKRGVGVHKRRT